MPQDENHELLKAQYFASCNRVSRSADAHSNRTKMLQAALDDDEEKGDDSKFVKLTKRMKRINGFREEMNHARTSTEEETEEEKEEEEEKV